MCWRRQVTRVFYAQTVKRLPWLAMKEKSLESYIAHCVLVFIGLALAKVNLLQSSTCSPQKTTNSHCQGINMQARYHKVVNTKQPQSQASSATWSDT